MRRIKRIYHFLISPFSFAICLWLITIFIILYLHESERTGKYFFNLKTFHPIEINFITYNNPECYYLYREQPMGFEYDLAKAFASAIHTRLNVHIAETWDKMVHLLNTLPNAFIGAGIPVPQQWREHVDVSDGYISVDYHLIVHRKKRRSKNIEDFVGKQVYVGKGSYYQEFLEELKQNGIDIQAKAVDYLSLEELISKVADEQIDATVANSNMAYLARRYYPQTVISDPIGEKKQLVWTTAKNNYKLLKTINHFIRQAKGRQNLSRIYSKYYSNIDSFDYVDIQIYHRRLESLLPCYEDIIKEAAELNGFDWRFITAMIYQESHFDVWAESYAGALGLMQLTLPTAESLGVDDIIDPEQNIHAGVKHLKYLYDLFSEFTSRDRLFVALAAYNIGQGHLRDAQRLARKLRLNPNRWSTLKKTLPLLQKKKYYADATYGYCRGTEPVHYVKQIMIYYDILKYQGIKKHIRLKNEPVVELGRN